MSNPIFVLGAALTDMVGFPIEQPALADSVPGRITKTSGGVGRNLAENLVRLGLTTELITAFGDDRNGKALLEECQTLNIGVRHSILANGQKGAIHLAIQDRQKDLFAGIADLSILDVLTPTYLESQLPALEEASIICLETNTPASAIDWLLTQELEVPIYLDPVSAQLASRVKNKLGRFHTIKVNRRQAEILGGQRLEQRSDIEQVARKWLAAGTQRVFITLGDQGAYAADLERQIHLPAAKIAVADTTGAGDAFQAGLIWASLKKWSLEDCCRAGLAASTVAVRTEGAINKEMSQATLLEHIRKFC